MSGVLQSLAQPTMPPTMDLLERAHAARGVLPARAAPPGAAEEHFEAQAQVVIPPPGGTHARHVPLISSRAVATLPMIPTDDRIAGGIVGKRSSSCFYTYL